MKTKFIVALVIQALLIIMMFTYALVQKTAAVKAQLEALAGAKLAEENQTRAEKAMLDLVLQKEAAKNVQDRLEAELKSCRQR